MKIHTKYFGEITIAEEKILNFPDPIPGFPQLHRYVLIPFFDEDDSMLCLQSVEESELAFVLLNPFLIEENYEPRLTDDDLAALQSHKNNPLAFYVLAVVKENFRDSTVNLKCPIAINQEKRLARQIIMEDDRYSIHVPINDGRKEA